MPGDGSKKTIIQLKCIVNVKSKMLATKTAIVSINIHNQSHLYSAMTDQKCFFHPEVVLKAFTYVFHAFSYTFLGWKPFRLV